MTSYELSRNWFDWCFENPEKISPNHSALYFFCIEHCNRLGWKQKFGLPTTMAKEAIGIKSYNTYSKTLTDLVNWGFINMIEFSKNQYSANIIALSKNDKALNKALDKALIKHTSKQSESTSESIDSIDKQINNITINNKELYFEKFWDIYDKKVDTKKCKDQFYKLNEKEMLLILDVVQKYVNSTPDKQFRKNPMTWLNGKCWNDTVIVIETKLSGEDEYYNNVMKQVNANKLL